jgi:hypothetical protein
MIVYQNPFALRTAAVIEPVFVGAVTAGYYNVLDHQVSLTGTLTGGVADTPSSGDEVVVAILGGDYSDRSCVISDPSSVAYTALAELYVSDGRDANLFVARKRMGSTPDAYVQWTDNFLATLGKSAAVCVQVWRGIDATTPIDVAVVTATGVNGANVNPSAVTPATNRSIILAIGGSALRAEAEGGEPSRTGYSPSTYKYYKSAYTTPDVLVKCAIEAKRWYTGDGAIDPPAWVDPDTIYIDDASWAAACVVLRPAT